MESVTTAGKRTREIPVNSKQPDVAPPLPSEDEGAAVMTFTKKLHDFGKMKQGSKKEYTFEFKNTGKEDLLIEYAAGSCGCTVPDWPKKPIPPGGTGEIKVEFDSTDKFGEEETEVTVIANTNPVVTTIRVKAEIEE